MTTSFAAGATPSPANIRSRASAHVSAACERCHYYQKDLEDEVDGLGQSECWRYPPKASQDGGVAAFPIVRSCDWCGEFEEKASQ